MTRVCLILVSILALAAPALAQDEELPPPPPPEEAPAAPAAEAQPSAPAPEAAAEDSSGSSEDYASAPADAGARTHDGFHLRFALGFGGVSDTMTAKLGISNVEVTLDGKASGASISGHLGIAGEVAEGLFLGGALMSEQVTNPEVEFEGMPIMGIEVGALGMLGLMLDWYPDPHGGFHFGGVLGGASLSTEDTEGNVTDADERPAGGCGVLMVGYDFWIGDEWSLGVLGRFTGAHLGGNVDHDVGAGSILFSVLYN